MKTNLGEINSILVTVEEKISKFEDTAIEPPKIKGKKIKPSVN